MLFNAYISVFGPKIDDAKHIRQVIDDLFSDDIKTLSKRLTDDELIEIANRVKAKKGYDFFNEIVLFCTAIVDKVRENRELNKLR